MLAHPNKVNHKTRLRRFSKFFLVVLFFSVILTGCSKTAWDQHKGDISVITWHEGLLRKIDPVDSALPGSDILAIFSYQHHNSLYIRIDILEPLDPTSSLHLALADSLSTNEITGTNQLNFSYQTDQIIRINEIGQADRVDIVLDETGKDWISFKITGISQLTYQHASVSINIDQRIVDETGWIKLNQTVPPVPLLLAFYNTLQTNTPAQVLRSWDGAHTGPVGSRHGLRYLLEAAAAFQVPITLLDFKKSSTLAALDALPGKLLLEDLVKSNLVFIPEMVSGETNAQDSTLRLSRLSGLQLGIPVSTAVFGATSKVFPGYDIYFYATDSYYAGVYSSPTYRLIPVATGTQSSLLNNQGFTIQALQLLANLGASALTNDLMVFGGDLSVSLWGDPTIASKAMSYIVEHPWIHPVSYSDLYQLPAVPVSSFHSGCSNLLCYPEASQVYPEDEFKIWQSSIYPQLTSLSPNSVTDSAWQLYSRITNPTLDSKQALLQWQYRSTLDMLILAADWGNSPYTLQTCIEKPQQSFCVLSNNNILAILSPDSAGLLMLFTRQKGTVSQWIAPYSQFMVGLSDPSTWQMNSANPDPDLLEGGFSRFGERLQFQVDAVPALISFTSLDYAVEYELFKDSLEVTIDTQAPGEYKIPFMEKLSGTGSHFVSQNKLITEQAEENKLSIDISGSTSTQIISSDDSISFFEDPENPNQSYPPGHYLPYPFSVLVLNSKGLTTVSFSILDQ